MKLGRLLERATGELRAAGSPMPALDAQLWLGAVCELGRTQVLAHPERELSAAELARFESGLARLAAGEPLAYLTGRIEFYSLTFEVSPDTLIPRPETEHLVELALELAAALVAPRIADVGTGSGCIAVALAANNPAAHVVAIDASEAALRVAGRNAAAHGVAGRFQLLHGDLLAPLDAPVDLICANLPYVSDAEYEALPASVRDYEPAGALRGGPDGLRLIEELLAQAPGALRAGGWVLLEIGAAQGEAAVGLARRYFPAGSVELRQDYAGRDRLVVVSTDCRKETDLTRV